MIGLDKKRQGDNLILWASGPGWLFFSLFFWGGVAKTTLYHTLGAVDLCGKWWTSVCMDLELKTWPWSWHINETGSTQESLLHFQHLDMLGLKHTSLDIDLHNYLNILVGCPKVWMKTSDASDPLGFGLVKICLGGLLSCLLGSTSYWE